MPLGDCMQSPVSLWIAARFLRNFITILPYRIHIILPPSHGLQANHCRAMDNGIQFTNRKQDTTAFEHIFDRVCRENGIEHRLTKIAHPWTNGQVERMNRTLKEATVKRYHYDTHDQLKTHLSDFVDAYNYARRHSKASRRSNTSAKSEPERLNVNPTHHKLGLNI